MDNMEYQAMIHSAEKLNDVIAASDPKSIALYLYSAELLLTPGVYQEVAFLDITPAARANKSWTLSLWK